MAITLQSAGTVREILESAAAQLQAAGTVREFLLFSPTAFETSRLVRETLLGGVVSVTALQQALLVREALTPNTLVVGSLIARESLAHYAPTVFKVSWSVREVLEFSNALARFSRVAREALFRMAPAQMGFLGREALIIVQNVLSIGLSVRETLFDPFTVERFGLTVREALLEGVTRLTFSTVVRESLYLFSTLVRAQMSLPAREALIPNTLVVLSLGARESLLPGIPYIHATKVAREALFLDPSFVPPGKHRKAYVWINYGRT